ncbi:YitT family protein [Paenibacillus ginsengarvi]|uniref:YitT family protein n=1 Tax=Paenibacillus ginsengarvi TaxID=400777 RepID=A0A3B0CJH2_9BACL|nr:YitT family protein [Paenibacillus ginsengarvi]RKN85160.1 hypothetical protein D7M11_08710 [Paenibacillus ginsengarvi]
MRGAIFIGKRPNRARTPFRTGLFTLLSFCAGAVLIATGLELFLKPNRLMTGGTQGISIMLAHMTEMRLGLLLFFINVPFLFLAAPGIGRSSAALRLAALGAIAVLTLLLDPVPPLTEHPLAASLFGGAALGCGAGLIVRTGGYTDGVGEAVYWLKRKVPLSIAELVMLANLSILALGGILFGWDQAMYSVIAYFVAYQSLRYTMRGSHRYTIVRIRGHRHEAIRSGLLSLTGSNCWVAAPHEAADGLTVLISRQQESRVRELVLAADPEATIRMTPLGAVNDETYKYSGQ